MQKNECMNEIKKYITENNISYPIKNKNNNIYQKLKWIQGDTTISGKFNSDTLHNILYTIHDKRCMKPISCVE